MIEKSSATWNGIEEFVKQSIADLHEQNEGDLDIVRTSKIRGKLEFAREILALAKKPGEPVVVEKTGYGLDD